MLCCAVVCRVDLVLVGAEGVVENGGVINKLGTYQIALCAKVLNKPFYVAAESYKFARLYPLNQQVGLVGGFETKKTFVIPCRCQWVPSTVASTLLFWI